MRACLGDRPRRRRTTEVQPRQGLAFGIRCLLKLGVGKAWIDDANLNSEGQQLLAAGRSKRKQRGLCGTVGCPPRSVRNPAEDASDDQNRAFSGAHHFGQGAPQGVHDGDHVRLHHIVDMAGLEVQRHDCGASTRICHNRVEPSQAADEGFGFGELEVGSARLEPRAELIAQVFEPVLSSCEPHDGVFILDRKPREGLADSAACPGDENAFCHWFEVTYDTRATWGRSNSVDMAEVPIVEQVQAVDPPPEGAAADAMLKFAAYLRDVPSALEERPHDLARRFGVPLEIVEEAMTAARVTRTRYSARFDSEERGPLIRFWRIVQGIPAFLGKQILAVCALCGIGLAYSLFSSLRYHSSGALLTGSLIIVTSLFALSTASFMRARLRFAVLGAAIAAVSFVAFTLYLREQPPGETFWSRGLNAFRLATVMTFLGSVFTVSWSIVGSLYRIRQEDYAERQMDRLQLLQRIFVLQDRLGGSEAGRAKPIRLVTWMRRANEYWIWIALGIGVCLELAEIAGRSLLGGVRPTGPQAWQQIIVELILLAVTMVGYPLAGFIGGNWWRGAVAGLIVLGSGILITVLPISGVGFEAMMQQGRGAWVSIALSDALLVFLAVLAGVGATVEKHLRHKQRLHEADQAALLSEIVRYQQLLATGATVVCVMAVDCVGSTKMKSNADPYAVEFSFREYHEFVERIVLRNGGVVRSKVGDMSISEFQKSEDAYAAARTVQKQMQEFNQVSNKLAVPFRVRIGLHCGEVVGALDEVQFSRVIDVAAHLEKAAPAGGIALSDEAAAPLKTESFIELAQEVDGHKVYLSTDPTN